MPYRAPLYTLPTGITFDATLGFVGTAVDTTYAEPATQVVLTDQGSPSANTAALQAAIDAAAVASTGGTTIIVPAGSIYNGITLRARGGDGGWIYIVSSARSQLPPAQLGDVPGDPSTRVSPSDAVHMPRIVNEVSAGKAVDVEPAAHHYRLVGIEATTDDAVACFNMIYLSLDSPGMATESNFPHDIGLDRCYLHGSAVRLDMQRAVFCDVDNGFIVGCDIRSVMHNGNDAQAILAGRAHGPHKFCNNYLEATGENIMTGGTDAEVAGLVTSDIEIRSNTCFKPLSWNPSDPSYDGIFRDIKNTFELKNAIRVLFEGNVGENCWLGAGSQYYMMNLKTTNQDGTDTWVTTHDITVCYNKFLNCFGAWSLAGAPEANPVGAPMHLVDIYDNLVVHGDPALLGGAVGQFTSIAINTTGPGIHIRHNTFAGQNVNSVLFTTGISQDVDVSNNVFRRTTTWGGASGGIKGDGAEATDSTNDGTAIFTAYTTSFAFAGNGFYDSAGGTVAERGRYTTAPSTNTLIDTVESGVFANPATGNYRLRSGVLSGITTDGDIAGANMDLIDSAIIGGGTPAPQAGFTFASVSDDDAGAPPTRRPSIPDDMSIVQGDTTPIPFFMADSTDSTGLTGKTGLTPAVVLSKAGGAFAAAAGTVEEIGAGFYALTPTAADTGTLGFLALKATAAGADPWYDVFKIDPAGPLASDYTADRASKIDDIDTVLADVAALHNLSIADVLTALANYAAAKNTDVLDVNVARQNGVDVIGTGTDADPWRAAGT